MLLIEEYITQAKSERQKHIDLNDPCIERGGPQNGGLSSYCKGLMAHLLDTTIPTGHKIHVCHACSNDKCSNPNHLYWGTASENAIDRMKNGDKTVWDKMVAKYGEEDARKRYSQVRIGNTFGAGNKGKPKSEEHKRKIAENRKGGRQKKTGN